MYKSDSALKTETNTVIKVNGNREITPPLDNGLRTNIIDSKLNLAGGNVMIGLLGATTELTATDSKSFVQLHQIEDLISASAYDDTPVFYKDGSRNMTGSISFTSGDKGVLWNGGSYIKDNAGVVTFNSSGADFQFTGGDATFSASIHVNGDVEVIGSSVFVDDTYGVEWDSGSSIKDVSGDIVLDPNGDVIFSGLTASTLGYLNASKEFVSLANASGVLTNNGSGGLSWAAGGGIPTQITVANEATDTTCFPLFVTAATGDLAPKTNANLTFNSNTGVISLLSPILTTPVLGTPASGTLTNCTGLPFSGLASLPSADILVGNGSNVATAVAVSGDATISNAGAITLSEQTRWQTVKVTVSSAQILALNSSPITLLAAPGAGKTYYIQDVLVRYNNVTTAYATNLTLQVIYSGATLSISQNATILTSTVTRIGYMLNTAVSAASSTQVLENTALTLRVAAGNPTAGDGTMDIYITYKVLTL